MPNIIGTVSHRDDSPDLDVIVSDATIRWLDAMPYSQVLGLMPWTPPDKSFDSRLVFSTYSNGIVSLTLTTAVILGEGIVSRIDLTVDARISRSATELLFDLLDTVVLPTSAPTTNASGADVLDYRDSIATRAMRA